MSTLYRKYRPQSFSDVTGQEHIIKTITNEISTGQVAHAYLFSGPRGVGKTTTARLLAKAVNCTDRPEGNFEPCEKCISCQEITVGRNIDVIEIDAASQTGVDNVRENIIENSRFKPTKSKYKVFIIDEVHMLTTNAFNALLKTLEEPPAHVIFILATTELHDLPETVISRCQRFNFKKIKYEEMLARLESLTKEENVKVEKEVLDRIINKSDGCLRDAESLLGQVLSLNLKKITTEDAQLILPSSNVETILDFTDHLLNKESAEAINLINSLSENGANLEQFAYDLIEILRVIMIGQATNFVRFTTDYSEENNKKIKELAEKFPTKDITYLLEQIIDRRVQIKTSPLPQLPLELLVVKFSKPEETITPPPMVSASSKDTPLKNTTTPVAASTLLATPPTAKTSTLEISDPSRPTSNSPLKTTLDDIKNKWSEIVEEISTTHHSLTFILKMCGLQGIDRNGLCIAVPFEFHKDKLEEVKNKRAIEDIFEKKLNERVPFYCQIAPQNTAPENNNELNNLAAEFGGELV